jgi:hydrogenase maturation protease
MANKLLLIGYGNPGRLDDGLGPALAEAVAALAIPAVTVEADYQLAVEDAATVAAHEVVVFADAAVSGPEPFAFGSVQPAAEGCVGFSSHSVEPAAVLALARDLFGARTRGYALGIRGYRFNEFGERLSEQAEANLAAAVRFLVPVLRDGGFDAAVRAAGVGGSPVETRTCPCETEST